MSAAATEELRESSRTNTMLSAAIEFGGTVQNVFVRNLSVAGAMVEGRGLPEQGERVVLHRSDYRIPATVMWRAEGRCGLSFTQLVSVPDMIRRKGAPAHQGRVDAIQQALRQNKAVPSFNETEALVGAAAVGKRLADEISYALRLTEAANEALADDPDVLGRHGVVLQQIDEVEQLLRKIADRLVAERAQGRC
ncbi:PilZ domain-containing protein [Sphingomonas tabacisoli]|uniref:PilZ domain-containing protein n=1 Tax=Sphingomonas tabacisoli TaxID=2249466 RepID=A0ABW4I116_9SPHN